VHSKEFYRRRHRNLFVGKCIIARVDTKSQSFVIRYVLLLEKPVIGFLFGFIVYFVLSSLGGSPFRLREFAYFNYLADAFLHGQLHLRILPPTVHDLSFFKGNYYLYWPPMPAVVMMPFVAIFGIGFSDVFFNVVVAAINVAVMAALLRAADYEKLINLDAQYRALLVLFFTLGTVHVILAPFGRIWFTAQLLGFLFVGLAYLSALKFNGAAAFLAVGILMAFAMLTRNHLLFTGIWPAYYLLSKNWNDRPKLYSYVSLALLPILALGLLFLAYNFVRFGSPFELGIRYHDMASLFVADYQKYGAFNLHYLPINFYYQYIYYPLPVSSETQMGGSLFLLSPVFFYAFRGILREYRNPNIWMWVFSILATSIPILLLMGTGWVQYGPRYTLDFTVPLLLLTASGVQSTSKPLLTILIAISIAQYIPGILLFARLYK
jgi:hypothetical protein